MKAPFPYRHRSRLRPLDHYVTLGRSGLRVSPFALGAMTFGEDPPGAGCSTEESGKILSAYLELGGNFIDTANFYTNGHAEKILGDSSRPARGGASTWCWRRSSSATCSPGTPTGRCGPDRDHRPARGVPAPHAD
jgi:hypothetical protein